MTQGVSDVTYLRDEGTGFSVGVPAEAVNRKSFKFLRKRIHASTPHEETAELSVDWSKKTFRMSKYPPLGFFIGWKVYIIIGALLIAACSQMSFYFPCSTGYSDITFKGASYCVPSDRVQDITDSVCPADICSKRTLVTMQTYAVLLNGVIAGKTGYLATLFYVFLVCVGAPFNSQRKYQPVWEKGAILGTNGGFFMGFIAASYIMGKCAEKGHDRPRSAYFMVPYLIVATLVTYAFGLFWLPFGMAIQRGVSPSAICPKEAGASKCLKNIFNWGMVPFIPGDIFKLFLVLFTVPLLWWITVIFYRRKNGYTAALTNVNESEYIDEVDAVEIVNLDDAEKGQEVNRSSQSSVDTDEVKRA